MMRSQRLDRPHPFRPRALVFDMDGLLVDSEPLWARVEEEFMAARGAAWPLAMAHACVGRGTPFTLRKMSEVLGHEIDTALAEAEIFDRFVAAVGSLSLKPGAAELLDEAAPRVPLALGSSSPRRLVEAVLRRFDLASRFAAVVTGEDVRALKPAPDTFLKAAEVVGALPTSCAVLEDSITGATAGRAAGMFVIAVPEGSPDGRGFEAVADAIVRDLFEARALLDLSG